MKVDAGYYTELKLPHDLQLPNNLLNKIKEVWGNLASLARELLP